jgi:hypothetical protein
LKRCQRGGTNPRLSSPLTLFEDGLQLGTELAPEAGRVRQNGEAMQDARKS